MPSPREITEKFWKSLHTDRVFMLGVEGAEHGHFRPMTAITEHEIGGPVWMFTQHDNAVVQPLRGGKKRAMATYCAKGHDLFATIHGTIELDTNREMIDKLWNPLVAAWYEEGKNDPKLALLRFDAYRGEIWLNESAIWAGAKMLFGTDLKEEFPEKVARVAMGGRR